MPFLGLCQTVLINDLIIFRAFSSEEALCCLRDLSGRDRKYRDFVPFKWILGTLNNPLF